MGKQTVGEIEIEGEMEIDRRHGENIRPLTASRGND
jgi:hypothetical protein